ncbi:MAG TPA: LacI family DNA-binding transcriptional regulator [Candidatus Limiplasma sp.]|nr:LacI family DNA-binding transcriptional regulator [Candidatus Limiplasma sp.]HRX09672.1 LacI family DNA-binding transcriptional regulator [Candidatus Limiplasma sp.]
MAATMKDIAKMTGLGLATISKYLNGGKVRPKNQKLIDDAVRELRFVPNEFARSLKTRQSRTIGVVIPELGNQFITSIITTMEDLLRQHDYAVIVCDCRTDAKREKDAVSFLIHKRVDGLINMPTDTSGEHLRPALDAGIPIVLVDRILKSFSGKVSAVVVDNVDAAEKAVRHLLEEGHQDIGLILGNERIYTTQKRREGYLNAYEEFHASPREELIRFSDYTMEGGYRQMKALLKLPAPPTAVFVTNYEMTLGAMIALNEAGLTVPDDISLIGFDKLDLFGAMFPNLTLVKQPQNAIGECVARQLLHMLSKTSEQSHCQIITLSAQLQEGSSVKKRN